MVMTSDQIAAMTGGGQMQAMAGMQHSAMISQQAGAPFGNQVGGGGIGEQLMGRGVNFAAGIGSPLASGAMSLAGLDPMSLATRGLFGGGAVGAGVGMLGGGVLAGGLMAAQYAAKQAMIGMQQQQQLNAGLTQNYQFQGQTQRGFTLGEMGDIGQMMRQMSQQRIGSEFVGMGELNTLAQRMGQMGMARGVRDARDFSEKFKQMMDNVKEIAQAFNTNLEQAQQIMSSMRQSGIFRNQGAVAQQIRSWSMAGGIATQELSQAMQMGAQMSRAIGGTGTAGAAGGMRTMGQIGVMQQMGAISEEQIFNLTGQTGAAGRQALAQQQMQSAARFLQGGLGRRFIASLAAPEGDINEEDAEAYEAGGVGTGETMQRAYKNLAKVGRAGFIRREGRLRGMALARFGGMAPMAVMSQWLEQRGMDPNSDRGLIFMSRRLGISVDEAEQQLKQFRMRDIIESRRQGATEDADAWRRIERQREGMGLKGVKKSLEGFKHDVNSRIQQWGAELYTEGSNVLERWINKVTGKFVQSMDRDIGPAIREVLYGTSRMADELAETRFGMGRGIRGQEMVRGAVQDVMRGAPGGTGSISAVGAARAAGDIKRLEQSGWYQIGMQKSDRAYQQGLDQIRGWQAAYEEGLPQAQRISLDAETQRELRSRVARGGMELEGGKGARGLDTIRQFQGLLGRTSTAQAQRMEEAFSRAGGGRNGTELQMRMLGDVSRAAGLGFDWRMQMPELEGMAGEGFRTEMDRNQAVGQYMLGATGLGKRATQMNERGQQVGTAAKWGARILGGVGTFGLGAVAGVAGSLLGLPDPTESIGEWAAGKYRQAGGGVSNEIMQAAGREMFSERGQQLALDALSRNAATAQGAKDKLEERNLQLLERGGGMAGMTTIERGEFEMNNSILMAQDYVSFMEETKGQPTKQQIDDFVRRTPGAESWEDVQRRARGTLAAAGIKQGANQRELERRGREYGKKEMAGLRATGMLDKGRLTKGALERFRGISEAISGATQEEGGAMLSLAAGEAFGLAMTRAAAARESGNVAEAREQEKLAQMAVSKMSMEEKKKLSTELRGTGELGARWRAQLGSEVGIEQRLRRAGAGAGGQVGARGMGAIAESLGVSGLGGKRLQELAKMDPSKAARELAEEAGVKIGDVAGAEEYQKQLATVLKDLKDPKKAGKAASDLAQLRSSKAGQEAAVQKEEQRLKQSDPSYRMLGEIKEALAPLKDIAQHYKDNKPQKVEVPTPLPTTDADKGGEG